jgi:hypothetical protein
MESRAVLSADAAFAAVERKPPLIIGEIDLDLRDAERVRAVLRNPLEYSQRVEAVVTGLGIETLLPRHDARIARFLEIWTDDETTHGRALALVLQRLGLPEYVLTPGRLPPHNHLAGLLGRLSQRFHDIVEMIWATQGAMNEHLAMCAYNRMGELADESGEHGLRQTLFRRLRSHESAHKSFYAAVARERAMAMRPWQLRIAREIVVHTYAPVGAGGKRDKPAFGRTVHDLADDRWTDEIADPVQRIAERLLTRDAAPLPRFVRTSIEECLAVAS